MMQTQEPLTPPPRCETVIATVVDRDLPLCSQVVYFHLETFFQGETFLACITINAGSPDCYTVEKGVASLQS